MKKARYLLILLTIISIASSLLAFRIHYPASPRYLYCTTQYGDPGTILVYPTIAPSTTAFCTTVYHDSCFNLTTVNFKFRNR